MCGIVGVVSYTPVNQLLYDALLLLQHRGQDAAGIATNHTHGFSMYKANGLVRDVFRTRNMRSLLGNTGIGHVRYPTSGSFLSEEEAQPFYVNAPFEIILAHNGNLTNAEQLKIEMFKNDRRHLNTNSDTEVLLNVFAHELQQVTTGYSLDPSGLFKAVSMVHKRVQGSYAVIAQIAGYGLIGFRDPYGIRPMCLGFNETDYGLEYMLASESVALESLGFCLLRDIMPGEVIFIDNDGKLYNQQCAENPTLNPCAFEFVYLARPDSVIDGASVYATRLKMGEFLAEKIRCQIEHGDIDVVMPIPDSSRPAAIELALKLNLEYREGFIKNRYIGRTFIMPGQNLRKKSVRQKLNAIGTEFKNKSVLLVDDSIVRGTTSREIVQMAREAGAKRVIFASAAPPIKHQNVYGIDIPIRDELIAYGRTNEEICKEITADALIYQNVEALKRSISEVNPILQNFEASCFDGKYITGDISHDYLDHLEFIRKNSKQGLKNIVRQQLNINFPRVN